MLVPPSTKKLQPASQLAEKQKDGLSNMEMIFCPNCKKLTGYKRMLGFGTFFAVILTAGFWMLALPFYPKRCITCGLSKSESVPWYRTWRLGLVLVVGLAAFVAAMDELLTPEPSHPVVIIHGPNYDKPVKPSSNKEAEAPTADSQSYLSSEQQQAAPPAVPPRDNPASASELALATSESHELREDGRVYSVGLIVAASDIRVGTRLLAQGRAVSFDYASGMRSRPFAVIEDEQQPGKTLLCAMTGDEGEKVVSLYHVREVVRVSGEYMGTAGLAGYPAMPILSNCQVAGPANKVVRPVDFVN